MQYAKKAMQGTYIYTASSRKQHVNHRTARLELPSIGRQITNSQRNGFFENAL